MKPIKLAIAQINVIVGDIEGNTRKIINFIKKAKEKKAEVIVFPELAITGYPPKDLLTRRDFIEKNKKALYEITAHSDNIGVIVGYIHSEKRKTTKGLNIYDISARYMRENILYNSAVYIKDKSIIGIQPKIFLPNYDVFDEKRYFEPGKQTKVFKFEKIKLGITICEDIWIEDGPVKDLKNNGAELVINISASPFYIKKASLRRKLLEEKAKKYGVYIVYVNLVGGQDDLVFDGGSYIYDPYGTLLDAAPRFKEVLYLTDFSFKNPSIKEEGLEEVYSALIMGLHDYVKKNGFEKVVIGLSGGIDSSVVAVIATDALRKENVIGVLMPGPYSSAESITDAEKVAKNLGIKTIIIPINDIYERYLQILGIKRGEIKITEQNIQARIRANILMALSNEHGYLVLVTSNKSELAMGYSTLYGDMAGGFAVLSDIPKTMIYQLARYCNTLHGKEIIPESILTKPPSAELAPEQKDEDDLPPYPILDKIIHLYVEEELSIDEIIKNGFDRETVEYVAKKINKSEYKRKQAPLGIKITPKAFGFGRRMPITNFYY